MTVKELIEKINVSLETGAIKEDDTVFTASSSERGIDLNRVENICVPSLVLSPSFDGGSNQQLAFGEWE